MSKQTTAERIAEQARDYYQDTIYSAISPADVEKADAYTNEHLRLTVEVMDALGIFHASDRMLVAIAHAMRWTLDDIEAEAMEQAHEAAARQLISAYAEAIGDTVTEDDPEAIAAHQVAREAIGYTTATEEQRATVDDMVQAIADRATSDPDEAIAEAAAEPAPTYQRHELEAFLGEYVDAYDVDAIEAEATEHDPKTGRAVWTLEAVRDLAAIAERHELKA